MATAEECFLKNLTWVQCNDCLDQFSATTRFVVLQCSHSILCEPCVRKTVKRGPRPVVPCLHCKKDGHFEVIRHSMQPTLRRYFEAPEQQLGNAKSVQLFQDRQQEYCLRRMEFQNEKMRDFTNAMKGQVKRINKERENVERQNAQMQEYLLKRMTPEKLQHYLGKSLEELQICERKMATRAQTSKQEHLERSRHHRPPPDPEACFEDGRMSRSRARYRQPEKSGFEAAALNFSDSGSPSSHSNPSNKEKPLLQLVQERNFRRHISPSLTRVRPEYATGNAHHARDSNHHHPQSTQIRTTRQEQAQDEFERMGRMSRPTATYNRPPSMDFKR